MLAELLEEPIRTAEVFGDPDEARLLPEEEAYVTRATAARRTEFTTVRWCARQALARLGVPPAPIPVGDHGAPRWPDGVAGSLTHTAGYRAAAVALTTEVLTLGIDAEPDAALPGDVLPVVSTPAERSHLADLGLARPSVHWDRLLFCAKESTYKAWYPVAGRVLRFQDVLVTFDPGTSAFTTSVTVPGADVGGRAVTGFAGTWCSGHGVVVAAVSLLR